MSHASTSRINYLRRFRVWRGGADMDPGSEGTSEVRFAAYVAGLSSVLGHADRIGPLRVLHGSDTAGRAQECGTDGRQDGSGADGSAAPVAAAFCRRRELAG